MTIHYRLLIPGSEELSLQVDTEREYEEPPSAPDWAQLGFQKCPNCPLSETEHRFCPAAVDVQPLMDACGGLLSFIEVTATVELGERRMYTAQCDLQTALSSMLGLMMATSGCPILSRLRGMARQHLPFQTLQDSHVRIVGAWLLGRILDDDYRGTDSLAGLQELVQAIGLVNRAFMNRLQSAVSKDANLNALATLAASAMNVEFSLEDASADLERFAIR